MQEQVPCLILIQAFAEQCERRVSILPFNFAMYACTVQASLKTCIPSSLLQATMKRAKLESHDALDCEAAPVDPNIAADAEGCCEDAAPEASLS